jgi:hypothetical protein
MNDMEIGQIIILSIFGLGVLIGYIGTMLSKYDMKKYGWGYLQLFCTLVILLIAIIMTMSVNRLSNQLNDKCPEYEKTENVYRLKE